MKTRLLLLCFVVAFSISAGGARVSVLGSECRVRIQKAGAAIEETGDVLAQFTVIPETDKSCEGSFEFRVHYVGTNGETHFYAATETWTSKNGQAVDKTRKGFESYCT